MNRNTFYYLLLFLALGIAGRAQKTTAVRTNFVELDSLTSEQYLKLFDDLLIKFVNSPDVPSTVITYEPGGFENGASRLTVKKNKRYYVFLSGDAVTNKSVLICEKQRKKSRFPLLRVTFLYDHTKEKGYIECAQFTSKEKKKIISDPTLAMERFNSLLNHN